MSRALLLNVSEPEARKACADFDIEISVVEKLESGGVRLVCASGGGAARLRHKLRTKIIEGPVKRSLVFSRGMQPDPHRRPAEDRAPTPFSTGRSGQ